MVPCGAVQAQENVRYHRIRVGVPGHLLPLVSQPPKVTHLPRRFPCRRIGESYAVALLQIKEDIVGVTGCTGGAGNPLIGFSTSLQVFFSPARPAFICCLLVAFITYRACRAVILRFNEAPLVSSFCCSQPFPKHSANNAEKKSPLLSALCQCSVESTAEYRRVMHFLNA